MTGKMVAKIASAATVGLVLGGPPAALVAAGVTWGVVEPEYRLPIKKNTPSK